MASHIVKGLPFLRNKESINFAITNLVDLPAKGVADFLLKESINPSCRLHCPLVLFYILQRLATDQGTDCHDRTGERSTCFPSSSHTSRKSTPSFKDLSASYIELFLQRCKNGLRSPKVVHVILKRQFEDLFE